MRKQRKEKDEQDHVTTPEGYVDHLARLNRELYETTSYDKVPPDYMARTDDEEDPDD